MNRDIDAVRSWKRHWVNDLIAQWQKERTNKKRRVVIEFRLMGMSCKVIASILRVSEGQVTWLCKPPESTRQQIYDRSGRKCESCGKSIAKGHIHHILAEINTKPTDGLVDDFNRLENLAYLCRSCHAKIHHQ